MVEILVHYWKVEILVLIEAKFIAIKLTKAKASEKKNKSENGTFK